jgi:hypothetical protein
MHRISDDSGGAPLISFAFSLIQCSFERHLAALNRVNQILPTSFAQSKRFRYRVCTSSDPIGQSHGHPPFPDELL